MTATLIILAVSAILFVLGPIRSDLVAVCAAIALVLAGVLTPEEALSGFSNPIVIMMVGLFVVGGGIFSTGLAKMMGSRILSLAGTSETRLFVLLMLTTGGVGAFVSNTGTVALMLPIVVSMARAAGLQSSRFLMPLAFAGSMGGMLTLIGTPPNLVIRDALIHAGYGENVLSFFSFTPVGIVCLIVGILVLLPLSRRFLSKDTGENVKGKGKTLQQLAEEYQLDERLTTLKVTANSPVIGKTAKALNLHDTYGVTIVEIRREGGQKTPLLKRVEQYASADTEFADGDTILLSGPEDQVKLFAAENALLRCKKQKQSKNLAFYSVGIAEILLMSTSEMVGKTIRELDFRARYGVEDKPVLLFAVGDGNHSLATAKECYERQKKLTPREQWDSLPARYALCELVNLHDASLEFEPIHRVVFGVEPERVVEELLSALPGAYRGEGDGHVLRFSHAGGKGAVTVPRPEAQLEVGTLQPFLDAYVKEHGGSIDYIHGADVVRDLAARPGNIAFLLPAMGKEQLFPTVIRDGVLPRKTFSMGEAHDKRFYLEARKIR